ncbi:M20/M25/M40 family metallo-hydrolase [Colwellia sp. KU-HH00111]|uniref:M20/M25/M40 family metallo-hydrolase n=1 Tax=Colwellia sp. KU-HH00111 TaxID=3127652 RepID=UPI0033657E3D
MRFSFGKCFPLIVILATSINAVTSLTWAKTLNEAEIKTIEQLKQTALNTDLSYQILESLTTEVGHRRLGTEGDKKAIKWAVAKMKSLGFDKVWTEEVESPQWLRGDIEAQIKAPYPHDMAAIGLGGTVGTPAEGITAPVIEFKTFDDLKAAEKGSLAGKIAFVSYRMQAAIDGSGYGRAVSARGNGASVAAEKGALAFIMRSVGTDNNRSAHTGMMRYKDNIHKIPAAALANPDADILVNALKRDQPVDFYLKITAQHYPKNMIKSASVIGEITGSERPDEIVALGAHLDSWDVGTGAMDDGMGIGIVLATGAEIAKLPTQPKRTIRVILYAGEEVGFYGTKKYMELHKNEIDKHVIGAEWDFGLGKIYQITPGVGAKALNNIHELAQLLTPLGVAMSDKNDAIAQSDMSLLSKAGMPSVNFGADGMRYFDYHHTANDTLDKIDPEDYQQNTAVYMMFAYFAAQSDVDFRK